MERNKRKLALLGISLLFLSGCKIDKDNPAIYGVEKREQSVRASTILHFRYTYPNRKIDNCKSTMVSDYKVYHVDVNWYYTIPEELYKTSFVVNASGNDKKITEIK